MKTVGKKIRRINLGENETKIVVVFSASESPAESPAGEAEKRYLLQCLLENPSLCCYAGKGFEKMRMSHDGFRWIAELEWVIQNERELGK